MIKRIYDPVTPKDGLRVLADRLWPRGVKKEDAHVDLWVKNLAPTHSLRKWFDHDPNKWETFIKEYEKELSENSDLQLLEAEIKLHDRITLIYSAKDSQHNHALALKNFLKDRL